MASIIINGQSSFYVKTIANTGYPSSIYFLLQSNQFIQKPISIDFFYMSLLLLTTIVLMLKWDVFGELLGMP